MKIGSSRSINNYHKKLPSPVPGKAGGVVHKEVILGKGTDEPANDCLASQDENLKMLTEKHNDGKLAIIFSIVGAGVIAYHF